MKIITHIVIPEKDMTLLESITRNRECPCCGHLVVIKTPEEIGKELSYKIWSEVSNLEKGVQK